MFTDGIAGSNSFTFTFRRSKSVNPDGGTLQYSTNLIDWNPIRDQRIEDMGNFEMVQATVPVDSGDTAIFARLTCL